MNVNERIWTLERSGFPGVVIGAILDLEHAEVEAVLKNPTVVAAPPTSPGYQGAWDETRAYTKGSLVGRAGKLWAANIDTAAGVEPLAATGLGVYRGKTAVAALNDGVVTGFDIAVDAVAPTGSGLRGEAVELNVDGAGDVTLTVSGVGGLQSGDAYTSVRSAADVSILGDTYANSTPVVVTLPSAGKYGVFVVAQDAVLPLHVGVKVASGTAHVVAAPPIPWTAISSL